MCVMKHPFLNIEGMQPLDEERRSILQELQEQADKGARPNGLRPMHLGPGWQCPNCGKAHGPQVATCPEEPTGGSLRERLKSARA